MDSRLRGFFAFIGKHKLNAEKTRGAGRGAAVLYLAIGVSDGALKKPLRVILPQEVVWRSAFQ